MAKKEYKKPFVDYNAKKLLIRKDRNECLILASKELKKLLLERCKHFNITLKEVIIYHGDDVEVFQNTYINRMGPRSGPRLSQKQLLTYLRFLGVRVNILAVKDHFALKEQTEKNIKTLVDLRREKRLDMSRNKFKHVSED